MLSAFTFLETICLKGWAKLLLKNARSPLPVDVRLSKTGNLSNDVFERRTSTGSEVFSLLICLDANKFVLLSFLSLIRTIYPRVSTEPLPNDAKRPLPVDVRRSKTLLLKLLGSTPVSLPRSRFLDVTQRFHKRTWGSVA